MDDKEIGAADTASEAMQEDTESEAREDAESDIAEDTESDIARLPYSPTESYTPPLLEREEVEGIIDPKGADTGGEIRTYGKGRGRRSRSAPW